MQKGSEVRCQSSGAGFQEGDAAGFDQFFAADGADAFAGFRFEADLIWIELEDAGDSVADGVLIVGEFRSLGVNDTIEVHDAVARFINLRRREKKHFGRVSIAVGFFRVGKQSADIGQGGGAEDRIGHGVEQHIGIAVADELPIVRHIDASESQRTARRCAVRVFPNSNPQVARGPISSRWKASQFARIIPGGQKCDNASREEVGR